MIKHMPDIHQTVQLYQNNIHSIYWLGLIQQTAFGGNTYLIVNEDEAVLVDPGGRSNFSQIYNSVKTIIDPSNIASIILCHQDPDIAASITDWLEIYPDIQIISNPRTHALLPHYGKVDYTTYDIETNYRFSFKSGNTLQFIPACTY